MRLLVLRFSSIGDIVLTSPVLRCIRGQVKDAEIHFATKSAFADLVRFNPNVSKVHELGEDLGDLIARLKADAVTVTPEDTIDACMRLVTDKRIRHLPVLDKGRVVGVLSIGDLVKSVLGEQRETIEQLEAYIRS